MCELFFFGFWRPKRRPCWPQNGAHRRLSDVPRETTKKMRSAVKSSSTAKKAKRPRSPVQAYLASLPPKVRKRVNEMRAAIRAVAPRAIEGKSYGIPGYKLEGKRLVYCAGFKRHTSLFPMTAAIRRAYAAELEGYKTSTGTIQFPLDKPLPTAFVKRLVKARLAEMRAKARK